MNININISNRTFILLSTILILIITSGIIVAYNSAMLQGTPSAMGHSAGEINVDTNGDGTADAKLQEYITSNQGSFEPEAYTGQESVTFPNGMIMKDRLCCRQLRCYSHI